MPPMDSVMKNLALCEAEDSLAQDVAHHVRSATHDGVARSIDEALHHVVKDHAVRTHHAEDETVNSLLMFGAETFRCCREPSRSLPENFANDEDATDAITNFKRCNLLAYERVTGVTHRYCVLELCIVRYKTVDTTALVFKLTHCLTKRTTWLANKVALRYSCVGEEHFAEVAVGGHVGDATNFNAGGIHRHDDFADTCVWRAIVICATDEIAVVSISTKACPNFLTIDDPLVTVINC